MEANIISFKVLLDSAGKLVTEKAVVDLPKIKDSVSKETYYTLQTILRVVDVEVSKLHTRVESELDARAYKD